MKNRIFFCAKSDRGKVRNNNEDSFMIDNEISLAIVADGMGRHNSGEIASKMAVEIVKERYKQLIESNLKPSDYNDKYNIDTNRLAFSVKIANSIIYEKANLNQENKGMGTTLTACVFNNDILSIAHIGDSRAYLIRNKKMNQLSQDHSLVMEQFRKGIITKEQADKSPYQNILTKALGTQSQIEIDMIEIPLNEDDEILLCSDGLFKCINENKILEIIEAEKETDKAAEKLILAANENGGLDNITIVIGKVYKANFIEKLRNAVKFFKL